MEVPATLFGRLVAKIWADPTLEPRLKAEPIRVLAEFGINVPDGTSVDVLFDGPGLVHLVIPGKPENKDLSIEDLNKLTWAYESNSGPSGGSKSACAVDR